MNENYDQILSRDETFRECQQLIANTIRSLKFKYDSDEISLQTLKEQSERLSRVAIGLAMHLYPGKKGEIWQ